MVNRVKNIEGPGDYTDTGIKKERKGLIKEARDKARDIRRATGNTGSYCIVCGKEIKKGQAIRALPKDKNCQEVRLYHLRGCGPGSENWKAFKANGKKTPQEPFQWRQLTFNFTLGTD